MTREIRFEERMSEADALMWNLEADPVLRSTILSVWVLDQAPDRERFEAQLEHACRVIPRLRQRVVADPLELAPPRWELDPNFDLAFHLRRISVPAPGDDRALLDLAQPIAMQAFDKDRPLWELYLVDGLEDGQTAVIMKLHHAISDGVGLVRMTECLVERQREPREPRSDRCATPPAPEARHIGTWERSRDAFAHRVRRRREAVTGVVEGATRTTARWLRSPLSSARRAVETLASIGRVLAPSTEPMSPLMTERSLGVHFDAIHVPLEDLKRAGKAVGGTVNDAFVAAVGGGLARYHESQGVPVEALRMLMPVNMRSGDKGRRAGNQFAPARFAVPVGLSDPAERIRAVGSLVREQRDEPALPLIDPISTALGSLPNAAVIGLFGAMQKTTDFTTSNVPGPPFSTYVAGARIERFLPFGPLAGAAVNVTVFSYDGVMHVGINCDPAAVTDPGLLIECMRKSFDEVVGAV